MNVEEFIIATNNAKTSNEVFDLFLMVLNKFGYDRVCYSMITDHPSLGLKAGHGLFENYPADWMSYYVENGYTDLDPVPQHCFHSLTPFTWEDERLLAKCSDSQNKLMAEANEAKLHDGIAVPMHGLSGELSGVGLASSVGGADKSPNILSLIRLYALQFHVTYSEKNRQIVDYSKVIFTPREKEVLSWVAEGKSDEVISDILNMSYSTVRFHMNNIFRKLDVNERTLAVVKAIANGLILPSYVKMK